MLEEAGIAADTLDRFFRWVEDFCQAMADCPSYTLQDDFVAVEGPVVDYGDYGPMSAMWYKTNGRRYSDVLCRMAAFLLIEQQLTVGRTIDSDRWECYQEDQWLCSDWDAIRNFPLVDFSQREIGDYFTLFNPVPLKEALDGEGLGQAVRAEWKSREIAFSQGPVSLMTIWIQNQDRAAAAHAALLIETGGGLWLVEKTNPQSPYQAAVFSTMDQVREYLYQSIRQEDLKYGLETGPYAILQNEVPLA